VNAILEEIKQVEQKEILNLFDNAKGKLDKLKKEEKEKSRILKQEINKKKKDIVTELAQKLETIIPKTSIISSLIVKRLDGLVSQRLVHQCLPQKYKEEYRVNNAKKQKKREQKNGSKENLEEIKSAAIMPLNQKAGREEEKKEEKQKTNEVILVGAADDETYTHPKKDKENSSKHESFILTGSNPIYPSYQLHKQYEQHARIQSQLASTTTNIDKLVIKEEEEKEDVPSSSVYIKDNCNIIELEFPFSYKQMLNYTNSLVSNTEAKPIGWCNCIVDIKAEKIISSNFGRLKHE
jgi:hypothetical protein